MRVVGVPPGGPVAVGWPGVTRPGSWHSDGPATVPPGPCGRSLGRVRSFAVSIHPSAPGVPEPTQGGDGDDAGRPPMTTGIRLARLFASWAAVGIGIPMILRAELGASPFDVLNTGLSEVSGWSFGICFVVNSIVFFAAGRAMGARLGWACIAGTLVIGPLVNLVLDLIPEQEALAARIPLFVGGLLVIAVAICLVIPTELGPGPTEVLMLGLVARGMDVVPARWISDGLPVVIGAVIGGAFGVGTVAWVLVMAPMVKYGLRRMHYVPPRLVVVDI